MRTSHSSVVSWVKNHRSDFIAGGLVFLIALPLCLGISLASGYPAVAGIITAGVGGIITAVLSDSQLTIKGPAAGLIVIALGCVTDFGFSQGANLTADFAAYRKALAVGVVAGIIQIFVGLLRLGFITEVFPFSVIHGMLAAIGFIIIFKQIPVALGLDVSSSPLELPVKIFNNWSNLNPEIALIGGISLAILIFCATTKTSWIKRLPAQMLVLFAAIPIAHYFDLSHEHTYSWHRQVYHLTPKFLVNLPNSLSAAVVLPDFSALKEPKSLNWIILFTVIGSLESLVSVQAVDLLDPKKRKTNKNRDLLAVGVANTVVAFLGGLPMISEIVRSRANIDNGAKTSVSNGFHGFCLLFFVSFFPGLLHQIPLSALAAMLMFTGYRLASPSHFKAVFKTGWDQLVIFVVTIVFTLATDLLMGLGAGILTKFILHLMRGIPPHHFIDPKLEVAFDEENKVFTVTPKRALVFSNWLPVKKAITKLEKGERIILDLSYCPMVDHSVMERIHELSTDLKAKTLFLDVVGEDSLVPTSNHPNASRKKRRRTESRYV